MYLSGLIFFSSKYHNIHEGLNTLNSVYVPCAVVKLCQISKNYEYTTKLQIQQYKMRAAVKFCQISKVIGMYLSELLNVFVKFHICDACLSNSARSQGSSEWEGVCFVRRGVKISRARQVSVYININTIRWWFKYKYKILLRQYHHTNTFLLHIPAEIGLLDGELLGMPNCLENLSKERYIYCFSENTC